MFDRIDFRRIATAAAGAAVLSTACIVGAVAPAKAEAPAALTVADWQQSVDREIDRTMRMPTLRHPFDGHAIATLAVRFDEHGGFDGATIAKSSGDAAVDAEALRTAREVRYPVLPVGLRGTPRTVTMQLFFAQPVDGNVAREQIAAARLASDARRGTADTATTQTASR
jgi:TonB family protein